MNKKQAFTLIELLVVIAIVGILSGFIFVSMTSAINSAKDAKRKADLSSIEKALLVYGVNHGNTYPYSALDTYPCNLTGSTNPCTNTNLSTALSPYLGVLPTDPNGTSYTYTGVADASSFILTGTLSNGNSYYYSSPSLTWAELPSAWLTGFSYRKSHLIAGSTAGSQTNYQIKFIIHRGTGTDSDQDVYIGTSKIDATYKDLRFTSSDKTTLLNYYIASSDSNSATVWVKIPDIPASPAAATVYIYYGNTSATSVSNGNNTFIFFDDFNDGVIDAKWNTSMLASANETGGKLVTTGVQDWSNYNRAATATVNLAGNFMAESNLEWISSTWNLGYLMLDFFPASGDQILNGLCDYNASLTPSWFVQSNASTYYLSPDNSRAITGSMDISFSRVGSTVNGYEGPTLRSSGANAATFTQLRLVNFALSGYAGNTAKWDYVRVRNYTNPEPTHSTYTAEEFR